MISLYPKQIISKIVCYEYNKSNFLPVMSWGSGITCDSGDKE